jgi:hypothetical protein
MEPLERINAILNELDIPPATLIELKTQIILLGISEYQRGAELSLKLLKELNINDESADIGDKSD